MQEPCFVVRQDCKHVQIAHPSSESAAAPCIQQLIVRLTIHITYRRTSGPLAIANSPAYQPVTRYTVYLYTCRYRRLAIDVIGCSRGSVRNVGGLQRKIKYRNTNMLICAILVCSNTCSELRASFLGNASSLKPPRGNDQSSQTKVAKSVLVGFTEATSDR